VKLARKQLCPPLDGVAWTNERGVAEMMQSDVSQWRFVGASVVGTGHVQDGTGCDDCHAYLEREDGCLLVAVADGAGSATRAADGARHAVDLALQAGNELLSARDLPTSLMDWNTLLRQLVQRIRFGLQLLVQCEARTEASPDVLGATSYAQAPPDGAHAPDFAFSSAPVCALRQYDTTLICAIMAGEVLAVAQIGDGVVVTQSVKRDLRAVTRPDHGEYVNGTFFITEDDYLEHVQLAVVSLRDINGIALLTDGLERQALESYASNMPYEPFFSPLFSFANQPKTDPHELERELSDFLASERICATTDDDKTIVLAVRRPSPLATAAAVAPEDKQAENVEQKGQEDQFDQ